MARRREAEPDVIAGRPFTVEELARIRRLIEGWPFAHGHPHPHAIELEQIHAAGRRRRRGLMLWELDPFRTPDDVARAYDEESKP